MSKSVISIFILYYFHGLQINAVPFLYEVYKFSARLDISLSQVYNPLMFILF